MQAAQRGVKAAVMTQPEEDDPLKDKYGDYIMVQSAGQSGRTWTNVGALSPELKDQTVSVHSRMVWRGEGDSAFKP